MSHIIVFGIGFLAGSLVLYSLGPFIFKKSIYVQGTAAAFVLAVFALSGGPGWELIVTLSFSGDLGDVDARLGNGAGGAGEAVTVIVLACLAYAAYLTREYRLKAED